MNFALSFVFKYPNLHQFYITNSIKIREKTSSISFHFQQHTHELLHINPFFPNAPFLYPLKISGNPTVIWCFQRVEKRCIGSKWVNPKNAHHNFIRYQPFRTVIQIKIPFLAVSSNLHWFYSLYVFYVSLFLCSQQFLFD